LRLYGRRIAWGVWRMSDAEIQGRLQTLIQALDEFDDADVTLGDFRVLGRGSAPYAIILPGPVRAVRDEDPAHIEYTWTHTVEVWAQFQGDSLSGVTAARQAVLDMLATYPTLDDLDWINRGVTVVASDAPTYLWGKGQPTDQLPHFVGFRIQVTTVEDRYYDGYGEFA